MPDLFFPQLASGALTHYPVGKTKAVRTVRNVLMDGSLILLSDPAAARTLWALSYVDLSSADVAALQKHFFDCKGDYRAFTFIDPTGNMVVYSSDLTRSSWQKGSLLQITANMPDPLGGTNAFRLTNAGQTSQEITQLVVVPASYHYSLSCYVQSPVPTPLTLALRGQMSELSWQHNATAQWKRIDSHGRLNDNTVGVSAAIRLSPGQQISIYGPQLQAQPAPSRYTATGAKGGVYPLAHWAQEELIITARGPDQFSTAIAVEISE